MIYMKRIHMKNYVNIFRMMINSKTILMKRDVAFVCHAIKLQEFSQMKQSQTEHLTGMLQNNEHASSVLAFLRQKFFPTYL